MSSLLFAIFTNSVSMLLCWMAIRQALVRSNSDYWEFAGMNDPFYDIACYGNAGFDKALALLECYVGHKPTEDELHRLYFHRAFQCLQWYNVAIFKDRVGLNKDLNMDFNAVALMFLGMAKDLLERY